MEDDLSGVDILAAHAAVAALLPLRLEMSSEVHGVDALYHLVSLLDVVANPICRGAEVRCNTPPVVPSLIGTGCSGLSAYMISAFMISAVFPLYGSFATL